MATVCLMNKTEYDIKGLLEIAKAIGLTGEVIGIKSAPSTMTQVQKSLLFFNSLIGLDVSKPSEAILKTPASVDNFYQLVFLVLADERSVYDVLSRMNFPSITYPLNDGSCLLIVTASLGAWGSMLKANLFSEVILNDGELEILCKICANITKLFPHVFHCYKKIYATQKRFRLNQK